RHPEAVDLAGPALAGRQRQCPRAAAIVDDARTRCEVRIEPREAQRGARMSAGAECESRIERHDDGTGGADALVTRTYPEPVTEAHRMKVLEPLALPDAVGHRPHLDAHRVEPERGAERA